MLFPATTALFAGLFALVYVGLSVWVIAGRVASDTLQGDGGDGGLARRIRAHANFGEYVPIALIVIAFLEAGGGGHGLVTTLLVVLLAGRLVHPFGLFAPKNAPSQFAFRGGGQIATLLVLLVAGIALIAKVA